MQKINLNRYDGKEMSDQEALELERFTFNAHYTPDQLSAMQSLREKGRDLCELMISCVPGSADRSAAIRYLRLAIMQCNAAIALENIKL